MYTVLTNLVEHTCYNFDLSKSRALHDDLKSSMERLTPIITARVQDLHSKPDSGGDISASAIHTYGATFAKRLLTVGTKVNVTSEILIGNAYSVMGTVGVVVCQ